MWTFIGQGVCLGLVIFVHAYVVALGIEMENDKNSEKYRKMILQYKKRF